jgi:hypothetical protein
MNLGLNECLPTQSGVVSIGFDLLKPFLDSLPRKSERHPYQAQATIAHLAQALLLKLGIPNRQDFIHHQDLRIQMSSDGKGQADVHAAGVALDGGIDELLDFGKSDDLVELAAHFVFAHAHDGAVEVDVLAAGELGVKAGADFEQAGDAAFDLDLAGSGGGDARQDLEQGALARAVAADDAEHFALLDLES